MLHMKQNSYKLEIVNGLLRGKIHLRELSRKLNINPMTLSRKLKELSDENIVDFKQEGKNKVYFLKKTSEAKSYVFMTENFNLNKLIKKFPFIRSIVEKVQNNKQIDLAVLFGSYVKDNAKKDSDLDLYLETKNKKIKEDIELINSKLSVKIGKYNKENLLIKEIEKNHVIIKGVEKFYERTEFFK